MSHSETPARPDARGADAEAARPAAARPAADGAAADGAALGPNAGFVAELSALYAIDPALVGPEWADYFGRPAGTRSSVTGTGSSVTGTGSFENGTGSSVTGSGVGPSRPRAAGTNGHAPSPGGVPGTVGGGAAQRECDRLAAAYRRDGHLAAHTDPLSDSPPAAPGTLSLLAAEDLEADTAPPGAPPRAGRLGAFAARLRSVYCGTVGYEYAHLDDAEEREWLRAEIEDSDPPAVPREERQRRLARLIDAEGLETELHKTFVGAKRFSLEGGEAFMPLLSAAIESAASLGSTHAVIGMAHRGRLNVLTNLVGKPLEVLLSEFADRTPATVFGAGDVKYHFGHECDYVTPEGRAVRLRLAPNPSHLEAVNPVVEGMARALQDLHLGGNRAAVLPLLVHGDAAVAGQGVVAETAAFAGVRGYSTGGTLHVVINNQVGFTTGPRDARSGRYCTDGLRGFGMPVFHVNGEDVDACCRVADLAARFRARFARDVVIDLVCFRKYGHNEGDDPTFTQPHVYAVVKRKKPVAEVYASRLVADGDAGPDDGAAYRRRYKERFAAARAAAEALVVGEGCALHGRLRAADRPTAIGPDVLRETGRAFSSWPDGFTPHPKLGVLYEKRTKATDEGAGLDWGLCELLAFGSLSKEGVPVRLSGQDCERGTFSHRHLLLHDYARPAAGPFRPLDSLGGARVEAWNSILSEEAVMGFEFGYAADPASGLVLWEGQFGDFANGAQVVIDQFLASSEAKWGQRSSLVLLLPHGYEGQGPEHSSARLERFLQLSAEGNMTVCVPSSAAQYFHMLRRHAHAGVKRPLVVMTPKSLLRAPEASASAEDLTSGRFEEVLVTDVGEGAPTRTIFCSGKVYYDLVKEAREKKAPCRVVRIEQLYPFPEGAVRAALPAVPKRGKPNEVVWAQEEPENQGAWSFVRHRLSAVASAAVTYAGRAEAAATAGGSPAAHVREQRALVAAALGAA